jgi:hypothetical protein
MRDEIDKQLKLKELLKYNYETINKDVKVYAVNDFKRIDGPTLNRPDLIIINTKPTKKLFVTKNNIISPIGIELKDTKKWNDTTSGLIQAQDYLNYNYEIRETGLQVKLKTIAYSTSNAIKKGIVCEKFEDNALIERFAWKLGTPILLNYNQNLVWSFRNYYFNLDGTICGRFGKNGIFIKY